MKNNNIQNADSLKDLCLQAITAVKGKHAIALNVDTCTELFRWLVIATGTSSRHANAVADNVVSTLKQHGIAPLGVEGRAGADWCLVDAGDVVVHVMLPESRASYNLEQLWSGGQVVAPAVHEC